MFNCGSLYLTRNLVDAISILSGRTRGMMVQTTWEAIATDTHGLHQAKKKHFNIEGPSATSQIILQSQSFTKININISPGDFNKGIKHG